MPLERQLAYDGNSGTWIAYAREIGRLTDTQLGVLQ